MGRLKPCGYCSKDNIVVEKQPKLRFRGKPEEENRMGYCNGDCEYLTNRHNCKKYKKGLTYSSFSSRNISTGAVHERCSECNKDYRIAELEARLKPNDPEDSIRCRNCYRDIPIDDDYQYCPYCGQKL